MRNSLAGSRVLETNKEHSEQHNDAQNEAHGSDVKIGTSGLGIFLK